MNTAEFSQRIMIHKDKMYRFALSYLRVSEEAKDVVQDVMLKLWEDRDELGRIQNMEAWCMTMTRHKALDRLKRSDRKNKAELTDYNGPVDHERSPLRVVSAKDEMDQVKRILAGLNVGQRETFQLRDIEGYSYLEICDILQMNMSQVKVSIHRARKAVREQLQKMHDYGS